MRRLCYKRCLCRASDNTNAETAENMATTMKACNVPILATEVLCIASTQANAERIVNVATTLNLDKDRTIIAHRNESVCIQGSMIGRTDRNGPQGSGLNKGVSFTLNTIDRHAVAYEADECLCLSGNFCDRETTMNGSGMRTGASFTLNTVDRHGVAYDARNNKLGEGVSGTLQAKENGGYSLNFINPIIEAAPRHIVRRLMPIECGRLQGFPDGWAEIETLPPDMEPETAAFWRQVYATDCAIKGKRARKSILKRVNKLAAWHNRLHTDGAEYKMWGNGMALPNALFFVSRALAQISAEENRPVESLKLGSLFDGSGTMPLCAAMCGAQPVWASEVEPYPIAVTKTHLPGMKHLGSVTDIDGGKIEPTDVITFGSPCQDLSVAGKRAGLDGNRSGLFREAIRIILEMLEATNRKYPRFVIWENVPGALSSNGGKDFETVLNELLRLTGADQFVRQRGKWGGCAGYGAVAYRLVNAQYWGVPQRRRRIYAIADTRGESADQVLFERQGNGWHFEPRLPAGEEIAGIAGDGYRWHERMVEAKSAGGGMTPPTP